MNFREAAQEIHDVAKLKGWWNTTRHPLEIHALIHSEIGEATEAWRDGENRMIIIDGKPEGEPVELVDAIIRILDYFRAMGWDIEEVMEAKMKYNLTRPFRHGGKKA